MLKSVKDKLRNKYNISIAEIGDQDIWKTARLGVAIVCNDSGYANGVISRVQDFCSRLPEAVMTDCELEWR